MVTYRVFHDRSVQIGIMVVPKDFEDRGYTSRTVGERLRYEIDQIVRKTQTYAKKEQFAFAGDSELVDIEVPKTDLSFYSVVRFLQDSLGLQPLQVTGEITEDKDGLIATVSISHSLRLVSDPVFERTKPQGDFKSLIEEMAQSTLELIDPYVLAMHAQDNHDQHSTLQFISECDGTLAKWGWNLWGNVLVDDKRYDEAIEKYEKAIELDPKFAEAYYNWGNALDDNPDPDYDGAIEKYEKAIELDPKFAIAYTGWGYALQAKPDPDYDGAIEKYEKAIELDPNYALTYYNLGSTFMNKPDPDYDGAIRELKKAIELGPKNADAYNNLGWTFIHKPDPDYDGAIKELKKAIELDPKFAKAYDNWGIALDDEPNHDYDGAIEKCQKAIELDPNYAMAYDDLNLVIRRDDQAADSVAKFMTMVKSVPNDWTWHYILGLLEVKAGDAKSGVIELQRAERLQPGNQIIQSALQGASN